MRQPIAPWWHTVIVLVTLAALSSAGRYQHGLPYFSLPGLNSRLSAYFTVIIAEWFLALLIWLALWRRGRSLGSLVSGRWPTIASFFRDLGISIAFIVVVVPLTGLLMSLVRSNASINMNHFTPKTLTELVVFLVLAITGGGFCEELIFRGYLTQQFSAWTGNRVFAVFFQGVVFGLCHAYYGKAMGVVMIEGCLLGLLAHWRKSLRPGILAHGLQDTIGGIAAFLSR
jgi:membrane protease YdiL (CAAX protease family)